MDAAMTLADASGIRALSMRQIGDHLSVQAMSLYNHVSGKDALLSAMADHVFGEIPLEVPNADWKTSLRATATGAHDLFLAHPWACELVLTPGSIDFPNARLRYMESILARLRPVSYTHLCSIH